MQRLAKRKDRAEKWTWLLCPKIQKKLDNETPLAHRYKCFELTVSCFPSSQHSVNIQEWTCSCRKWQLIGIPCIHAIFQAVYSHLISPVRSEQQWATNDTMEPIFPPMFRRPPGKPHKKRKREADEAPPMTSKLTCNPFDPVQSQNRPEVVTRGIPESNPKVQLR
ncbi:hypothetical protein GQ457_08G037530 [Hibiscus cannabinus]